MDFIIGALKYNFKFFCVLGKGIIINAILYLNPYFNYLNSNIRSGCYIENSLHSHFSRFNTLHALLQTAIP